MQKNEDTPNNQASRHDHYELVPGRWMGAVIAASSAAVGARVAQRHTIKWYFAQHCVLQTELPLLCSGELEHLSRQLLQQTVASSRRPHLEVIACGRAICALQTQTIINVLPHPQPFQLSRTCF